MQKSLMRDLYLRKDTLGNREFSARDAVQPRCLCNVKDLDNEDRYVAEISSHAYTRNWLDVTLLAYDSITHYE